MSEAADASRVFAVHSSPSHSFSKPTRASITLIAGLGVEGDAHCGAKVRHRSRVARDPSQPNLRQVHLLHNELLEALTQQGFAVDPGAAGENITTAGIDLLALSKDTELHIGPDAVVRITGLRNPCRQLESLQTGLMNAMLDRRRDGTIVRKGGVMGIVVHSGRVTAGDRIIVRATPDDYAPLEPV